MEYQKSRLERFIVAGLLALVVWAPIPLGSNRDWSEALLILLVGVLAFLWGLHLLRHPDSNKSLKTPGLVMLGMLALTQCWVAIQWLFGLSANPGASFKYLMLGITYTLMFVMVIGLFNTRKRLAHFEVKGSWDNDLMQQIKEPSKIP